MNDNYENDSNKLFSDTNDNFQINNMVYKLKKIKKKKKPVNNYKNIEVLETLENINSDPVYDASSNVVKEGFTDNDYEGIDNVNDNKEDGGISPSDQLVKLINKAYNSVVKINRIIAQKIVKILSKNHSNYAAGKKEEGIKNDEQLLYTYICMFESVAFSAYVVNNWYFLMYFNHYQKKIPVLDISRDSIRYSDNRFLKFMLTFTEYAIYFPEKLNSLLLYTLPDQSIKVFNHTVCYLIIFCVCVIISYNFASGFKNFLIDIVKVNSKNVIVSLMYLIVIALFMIPSNEIFHKAMTLYQPILILFTNILLFIVVITTNVPLAGFLCVLYFLFYSLFGMLFYNSFNPIQLFTTFNEMMLYIKGQNVNIFENPCREPTWYEKILDKMNQLLDFSYSFIFQLAFIIIIIYAIVDGQKNMSSNLLKQNLLIIDIMLIVVMLSQLYSSMKTDASSKESDDVITEVPKTALSYLFVGTNATFVALIIYSIIGKIAK
jgi:hypothetical protein